MTEAWKRHVAAIAACVLALIFMIISTWSGVKSANDVSKAHVMDVMMDSTSNVSRYICTYFDNLIRMNEGLGAIVSRTDDILQSDIASALSDALTWLPTGEFTVMRLDGAFVSTSGAYGIGTIEKELLDGADNVINSFDRNISVSTAVHRSGSMIGAMTGIYSSDKIASAVSVTVMGDACSFVVFKPSGEYVLRSDACTYYGNNVYESESHSFADGYSAEKLNTDIKAGRSGEVEYCAEDGSRLYGYYMVLGINDWYIMCMAPQSSISWHVIDSKYILIALASKLVLIAAVLLIVLVSLGKRREHELSTNIEQLNACIRKLQLALGTLDAPAFEFDMHALEAKPICDDMQEDKWLIDRLLIPECASEIVDSRDEPAYLKLCDALISARGRISGDIRLHRTPDQPTRMYRITLSEPESNGEDISMMATLVDIDDVAQRMDALRQRAACDDITGLATMSEMRIQAGRLLERPNHHFGTIAFIRADNQDAVCDVCPGMTQSQLMRKCGVFITEVFGECDVFARGAGNEFWVFSGDQTGVEIIQKGMNKVMDSNIVNSSVCLTFSCGIAHAEPDDNMDNIMHRAYSAAQLAHRDGGHRVQHG